MKKLHLQITKMALLLGMLMVLSSCAMTKKASIPSAWEKNINWQNFNSAEVTETDHTIIQNEEEIMVVSGSDGKSTYKELKESEGVFGSIGSAFKESLQNPLGADNDVAIKYWHVTLPETQTLLLFDRSKDEGEIISINLETGEIQWTSTEMPWNLERYADEVGIAVELLAESSLAAGALAGIASNVLLQSRAIQSMTAEVPGKDAFLFRMLNGKLSLVDSNTGDIQWSTEEFESSGIGALTYFSDSDEILIAGDMGNMKDVIKSADAEISMKKIYLIDGSTGELKWKANYNGREDATRNFVIREDEIILYFAGGFAEVFNYDDGTPMFRTIDDNLVGLRKATGAAFGEGEGNVLATRETADPVFEDSFVYAVNAVNTHAVGYPDKQLFKYDYKTGETMWESPVLAHAPDVRDMHITDELVIVRVSMGAPDDAMGKRGAVVGGVLDYGFYAYDKETGEQVWTYSEPFVKHVTNVIYGDNVAWAGGGGTVYKFRLDNGELIQKKSLDTGTLFMLHERVDNQLFARGWQGFAMLSMDSLKTGYTSGISGRLESYNISDRFYTVRSGKIISEKETIEVFDLIKEEQITEFTVAELEFGLYGGLDDDGYKRFSSPEQLLTITNNGLKSYHLNKN